MEVIVSSFHVLSYVQRKESNVEAHVTDKFGPWRGTFFEGCVSHSSVDHGVGVPHHGDLWCPCQSVLDVSIEP